MHKPSVREVATNLRLEGYSYPYISERVGVSKSTLSSWLGHLPYTPNKEMVSTLGNARTAANKRRVEIRQKAEEALKEGAIVEIGVLQSRDLLLFGLGVYLGEGSKNNGIVRITNSDPRVINLSIAWFISLGLSYENFFLTIHLYPDSEVEECLQFWSITTNIPRSQFGKTQIDNRTNKSKIKSGKLPMEPPIYPLEV